jgi:hypothetical protein
MMHTLTIDRIVARTPEADGVTDRVERIIRRVVEDRLDRMLSGFPLTGQGEWCVPTVNVAAVLDLERPDSALEESVARAVLDAIADALRGSTAVHYPGAADALAGLVVAAAARRLADAWMWSQMGLIADPGELERHPSSCVLAALEAHPEYALSAIIRAVRGCGLATVHRLLGEAGWIRLASTVIGATAAEGERKALEAVVAADRFIDHTVGKPNVGGGQGEPRPRIDRVADILAASRVVGVSRLAAAVRESRLRLDGPTVCALAVLAVAESEPAVLRRATAGSRCLAVARILTGAVAPIAEMDGAATEVRPAGRQPQAAAAPGKTDSARRPGNSGAAAPAGTTFGETAPGNTDAVVVRGEADAARGHTASGAERKPVGDETRWAGLLFLLNVAEDAGMPDALLADPDLDGIAASELLARIAVTLVPVAQDDPVVFAFAGADPQRTRCTWERPLAEALANRLQAHADAWATAVACRLGRDDDVASCLVETACRPGRIEREQGWMEVHLDLASVDIAIRRSGLDIDPGWVPWLGSVVRFRYV